MQPPNLQNLSRARSRFDVLASEETSFVFNASMEESAKQAYVRKGKKKEKNEDHLSQKSQPLNKSGAETSSSLNLSQSTTPEARTAEVEKQQHCCMKEDKKTGVGSSKARSATKNGIMGTEKMMEVDNRSAKLGLQGSLNLPHGLSVGRKRAPLTRSKPSPPPAPSEEKSWSSPPACFWVSYHYRVSGLQRD